MSTTSDVDLDLGERRAIELPVASLAAPLARQATRATLGEWGCGRTDDVELAVSELVTNAVVHARTAPTLILTLTAGAVQIEVHDAFRSGLIAAGASGASAAAGATGGLGLRVVGVLSDAWGWELTGPGKVVWAVFEQVT
jgi:anti-sigma regulatory factor (Ser/Thr protein kinase)